MASKVVLITGANRGIGNGIIQWYLSRPNHIVIAAIRDPSHPSSKALAELPRAEGTSLLVAKIDAARREDPYEAVNALKSEGIDHIDLLIANAGIALSWPRVIDVDTDEIQQHINVNVYGFLWLFQAMYPLLKSAKDPIWVTIGSSAAFLTPVRPILSVSCIPMNLNGSNLDPSRRNMLPMRNASYAPTKLMTHWYTKAIHIEEPWLTAFPIDPGWVQTDIGNRGAHSFGKEEATTTIEESARGVVKVIDAATRDTHSGKMWSYQGTEVPW